MDDQRSFGLLCHAAYAARNDTLSPSSRALRQQSVVIQKSAQADSSVKMDCHDSTTAESRNDKK